MGNKEEILELIEKEDSGLTSNEIAEKSGLTIENVKTYINRLKKENSITSIRKKGREHVWILKEENQEEAPKVSKDALKKLVFLNTFFKDNIDHIMESEKMVDFVMKNKAVFKDIEEMIKNGQ